MANGLKKAVFNLMEKAFISEGSVVGIRKWEPGTICEIDLHLPGTDMSKWRSIQRIVCKVGPYGEYRDYTPATWRVEERICTVIVEAAHEGLGSSWAKYLKIGDPVLFASTYAAPLPSKAGKMLCLGDGSALGHFLALKHLTDRKDYPLEAHVFLNEVYTIPGAFTAANPEFTFVMKPHADSLDVLQECTEDKRLADYASIYIAGYIPMVSGLRKILKKNPYLHARIFAQGFWS
jgi:NADPH-dependent ferric siderophore reductase